MTSTLPPIIQAFSGGVGSVVANVGSYPLDLVATRLQTRRGNVAKARRRVSATQVVQDILNEQGWKGLFAGIESDSAATLVSNFIYYYAYSYFRAALLGHKERRALKMSLEKGEALSATARTYPAIPMSHGKATAQMLSVLEELGVGFTAGVVSRFFSTPLSVVTVRLQLEGHTHEHDSSDSDEDIGKGKGRERGTVGEAIKQKFQGMASVVKEIYEDEGLPGFWRGFQTTILLCSNPAITLFLFQAFRRLFLRGKDRDHPTALQGFLGAAVSNTIAVCILYPLILIKTRVQSARNKGSTPSMIEMLKRIVKKNGVAGLYQGLDVQLVKGFFNQGLTMMTKQRIELMIVALYHVTRGSAAVI